jgi:predicted metal-dependent HD superfamily phosphohydrolase
MLDRWNNLMNNFAADGQVKARIGQNLVEQYQSQGRYYHNLGHISAMLDLLAQYKAQIADEPTLALAIWFHDAVYQPLRSDNEEKSAELARAELPLLNVPKSQVVKVEQFILATKRHELLIPDADLAYFLDFDLAILGSSQADYQQYVQQIRQEYHWYPDLVYRPGRRKVLESFLGRAKLFHRLGDQYEMVARQNLAREIATYV